MYYGIRLIPLEGKLSRLRFSQLNKYIYIPTPHLQRSKKFPLKFSSFYFFFWKKISGRNNYLNWFVSFQHLGGNQYLNVKCIALSRNKYFPHKGYLLWFPMFTIDRVAWDFVCFYDWVIFVSKYWPQYLPHRGTCQKILIVYISGANSSPIILHLLTLTHYSPMLSVAFHIETIDFFSNQNKWLVFILNAALCWHGFTHKDNYWIF